MARAQCPEEYAAAVRDYGLYKVDLGLEPLRSAPGSSPPPPGRRVPRRRRTELMEAALAQAAVLPNMDYRPRAPREGPNVAEEEDLSEEAIFLKLRMTFARPEGIEWERWYEMLTSFARRKAEQMQAERAAERAAASE